VGIHIFCLQVIGDRKRRKCKKFYMTDGSFWQKCTLETKHMLLFILLNIDMSISGCDYKRIMYSLVLNLLYLFEYQACSNLKLMFNKDHE